VKFLERTYKVMALDTQLVLSTSTQALRWLPPLQQRRQALRQ
jgi:hypothetical protein